MKEEKKRREDIELFVVATVIVAFLLFFLLKISGHFDFTHRYGIRNIEATIDEENVMAMIDDDSATAWNAPTFLGETTVSGGESITIYFDEEKTINGIRLYGRIPKELRITGESPSLTGGDEDVAFTTRKADEPEDGEDVTEFVFDRPVTTGLLSLTVVQGKERSWSIKELQIL